MVATCYVSTWVNHPLKRAIDIGVVVLLLPFLLWVISLQCVLIILIDRASPLVWQYRIGKHGKRFKFCKINTMGTFTAYDSGRGANDARATPLGKVLRLTILDEVPQIVVNVLRGDMALVGPRPLLPADFKLMKRRLSRTEYQSWYAAYTAGRPGWTGRFGIASRCLEPQSVAYLASRRRLDIYYVRHATAFMDTWVFIVHAILPLLDILRRLRSMDSFRMRKERQRHNIELLDSV